MLKGSLFTREFLTEGIQDYPEWKNLPAKQLENFRAALLAAFKQFPMQSSPNESQTERNLIDPIIDALGFKDYITQANASHKGRSDVPDYLLFEDAEHKKHAMGEKQAADAYRHGLSILEAKAWQVPLDRKAVNLTDRIPSNQILNYLNHVETISDQRIRFGILTNGRLWRLYFQGAKSRSEDFLELDLPQVLELPGFQQELPLQTGETKQDWLKVFYLLFRREAFVKTGKETSFHENALAEGRHWEAKVSQSLSDVVFHKVFPSLVQGLWKHDPSAPKQPDAAYLTELREAALTLLYRLLFVLFAEDRHLLPVKSNKYDDYGLRLIRHDIERRLNINDVFSESQDKYYHHLKNLFKAIDKGDGSIGLPPYNGGLFDYSAHPLLNRAELPDAIAAPLIDNLSRRDEDGRRKWINYRDLTVQQLGSIYERLLEFELKPEKGSISVAPNIFARKTSGSYYTPEPLVRLALEKSVGILLNERLAAFTAKCEELGSKRTPKAERIKDLERHDAATQMLELRICDPAMGSGHFLVSLVDYLADRVLEAMDEAEKLVDWADKDAPYVSPLEARIQTIRKHIKQHATANNWAVEDEQLDDRHIVRRMILKRCIYGVDKNTMAVELAKVSLWLHTFTVGAPLSFLDHHLRCGDSLFGEFVHGAETFMQKHGALFIGQEVVKAKQTAKGMAMIERITDADISEVKESKSKFDDIAEATRPINAFFSLLHATRWQDPKDKEVAKLKALFLDGQLGDPIKLAGGTIKLSDKASVEARAWWQGLKELAQEENFLHWEISFPGVWEQWENVHPTGGFDAVIGNPPWDKIKMQEVEWFAARRPEIALKQKASDRKEMVADLKKSGDPLSLDYEKAAARAEASARVARDKGDYPLLSGGDIDIYSLFVERAHRLVKDNGLVGVVIPSGIASDLGASEFIKSIATNSRLAGFYDFENKKIFFQDVHASKKFAIYVAGGKNRKFKQTEMAFFLHDVAEIKDPERCFALTAEDFARVNPNTGTAPIFRTRRDAEITKHIYEKFPVLVRYDVEKLAEIEKQKFKKKEDREAAIEACIHRPWPVKYNTMFHMTNDSGKFRTRAELEKEGCYPVDGNHWKKGKEEYVPLYEGKMVQAYDHRAANVVVNEANLNRPAQPEDATVEQHKNPAWLPTPQFWVNHKTLESYPTLGWWFGFKDVTATTNVRSMIASIIPVSGVGNTFPLVLPRVDDEVAIDDYRQYAPLLLANFNSFIFDYIARQKIQGQHLNWFIVEQLPIIPPAQFEKKLGKTTLGDFIREQVLHLTYTANDMAPLAQDMGYKGAPFAWDEEDRRHRCARLDALFFILYGLSREDASYILSTFNIVQKDDEATHGRFLTRDLILAYMNALAAGDVESKVAA